LESNLITCACCSPEHSLQLDYSEEYNELCIYIHMNKLSFIKRFWYGVRYIFGYQTRYGHYEECLFNNKDCDKMLELFSKIKKKDNK